MTEVFYILYCESADAYVYEERQDCWQYTGQDFALRFPNLREVKKARKKLETEGFPPLTIFKMKQTTTIIKKIRTQEKKHVSA